MQRWHAGAFRRLLQLRDPIVGIAIPAENITEEKALSRGEIVGADILPDHLAFRRHLEDAATMGFRYQRIAIR